MPAMGLATGPTPSASISTPLVNSSNLFFTDRNSAQTMGYAFCGKIGHYVHSCDRTTSTSPLVKQSQMTAVDLDFSIGLTLVLLQLSSAWAEPPSKGSADRSETSAGLKMAVSTRFKRRLGRIWVWIADQTCLVLGPKPRTYSIHYFSPAAWPTRSASRPLDRPTRASIVIAILLGRAPFNFVHSCVTQFVLIPLGLSAADSAKPLGHLGLLRHARSYHRGLGQWVLWLVPPTRPATYLVQAPIGLGLGYHRFGRLGHQGPGQGQKQPQRQQQAMGMVQTPVRVACLQTHPVKLTAPLAPYAYASEACMPHHMHVEGLVVGGLPVCEGVRVAGTLSCWCHVVSALALHMLVCVDMSSGGSEAGPGTHEHVAPTDLALHVVHTGMPHQAHNDWHAGWWGAGSVVLREAGLNEGGLYDEAILFPRCNAALLYHRSTTNLPQSHVCLFNPPTQALKMAPKKAKVVGSPLKTVRSTQSKLKAAKEQHLPGGAL
ncbi:hypothetical protein BC834DRAFT_847312 [Gloeopeniophorella convolvens]|nr:hypothetical protein BC834DRAFT_847312 [Gloeopeniophorella convolvens]